MSSTDGNNFEDVQDTPGSASADDIGMSVFDEAFFGTDVDTDELPSPESTHVNVESHENAATSADMLDVFNQLSRAIELSPPARPHGNVESLESVVPDGNTFDLFNVAPETDVLELINTLTNTNGTVENAVTNTHWTAENVTVSNGTVDRAATIYVSMRDLDKSATNADGEDMNNAVTNASLPNHGAEPPADSQASVENQNATTSVPMQTPADNQTLSGNEDAAVVTRQEVPPRDSQASMENQNATTSVPMQTPADNQTLSGNEDAAVVTRQEEPPRDSQAPAGDQNGVTNVPMQRRRVYRRRSSRNQGAAMVSRPEGPPMGAQAPGRASGFDAPDDRFGLVNNGPQHRMVPTTAEPTGNLAAPGYPPVPQPVPYQNTAYQPAPYQNTAYQIAAHQNTPYQPAPYQPAPYQPAPYQPAPYPNTPHQNMAYQNAPYQNTPYQTAAYETAAYQNTPYLNTSHHNTAYQAASYQTGPAFQPIRQGPVVPQHGGMGIAPHISHPAAYSVPRSHEVARHSFH
ncbi:uncharacterized protein MAM_07588 [Metarhizium album ARSEF 1941]|uniref:Uncharacterized protein n=1 Tax=Metarhizium album (strain ARSEF 1941) TaxID=1081103 RepID=A0A0B2WKR2_METAS|nr:uncharacterized protein MAM_07588 [Metarhizium album ARSEF 1941]KHN94533.1 hypothetical protein MAM_07588 [Metarhizium album ARSEF 1941]